MNTAVGPDRVQKKATAASATESGLEDATHCVVRGTHAFLLRVSSLFGLAPLKFESRGNGSYSVTLSKAKCTYGSICVPILSTIVILLFIMELTWLGSLSSEPWQNIVLLNIVVVVVVLIVGSGVFGSPQRMRDMFKFMEIVTLVDTKLGVQYSTMNERKVFGATLLILVFGAVVLLVEILRPLLTIQLYDLAWKTCLCRLSSYTMKYVVLIFELQFAITSYCVYTRFQAINEALSIIVRNFSSTVRGEFKITPSCGSIRQLLDLHISLCDVVPIVDNSYGLPLMMALTFQFLNLITKLYVLFTFAVHSNNKIYTLMYQALWCCLHLTKLFIIVEPCHRTEQEVQRTRELTCELMTSLPSTMMLTRRLELFSRQLMLQTVCYSPMGMCTLNRSLLISMLGTAVTYLIILIQLQN